MTEFSLYYMDIRRSCFHDTLTLNDKSVLVRNGSIQIRGRSSPPEVFLGKGVLQICSKFTGKHPCQRVISIKFIFLCVFIEITLPHGCSLVNLLHISRTSFYKNTFGGLFLQMACMLES